MRGLPIFISEELLINWMHTQLAKIRGGCCQRWWVAKICDTSLHYKVCGFGLETWTLISWPIFSHVSHNEKSNNRITRTKHDGSVNVGRITMYFFSSLSFRSSCEVWYIVLKHYSSNPHLNFSQGSLSIRDLKPMAWFMEMELVKKRITNCIKNISRFWM